MAYAKYQKETYPDRQTLRPVCVWDRDPTHQYYSDKREFLYYESKPRTFVFVALRGQWLEGYAPSPPASVRPPLTLLPVVVPPMLRVSPRVAPSLLFSLKLKPR